MPVKLIALLTKQGKQNYPLLAFTGEIFLNSDNTRIYVGAIHEFAPTANDFKQKATFYCPKNAPKAIADGHTLHFAIEIVNGIKDAFARMQAV